MSDALYGFATGFADGFTRSYSARLANEAQKEREEEADQRARERDKLRYGLDVWSKGVTAYEERKKADAENKKTAADIISNSNIPEDATARVMDLLSLDYSAKDIIQMDIDGRLSFSKPIVPEVEEVTGTPEPIIAEEDTQTDTMLATEANTDLSPAANDQGITSNPDEQNKPDTSTAVDSRSPLSQLSEIKGLRETLGVSDDYFNAVVAGYSTTTPEYNYDLKISPEVKAATSFEQAALQAAQADERYDEDNPTTNITILAEYKAKLSPKANEVPDNPKDAAMMILMGTSGYQTLVGENATEEDKAKAVQMLADLDAKFDAKTGSISYTQGNYVADVAKYTKMLNSENPEEVAAAKAWFETEKPALDAGFEAVGAMTKDGDSPTYNVMYTDNEGNQLQGLAEKITTKVDGKDSIGYKFADGTIRKGDSIVSVVDEDTAKRRQTAIQAASTEYKEVGELQASVVPAVHGLRELDKIALQNEVILSATGAGISLFERFKTEFGNLMELAGQGATDGEITRDTLLSQINDDFESMIEGNLFGGNKVNRSDAEAYKEFSAAMVRAIFNTGKALGQSGNGFSNNDYKVISGSLQASNSYTAFSRNLRRFSGELLMGWKTTAARAKSNPVVQAALSYPGAREMISVNLLDPREWYQKMTPEYVGDLDWASNTVTDQKRIINGVTDEDISNLNLPKELKGKRVVVFFELTDQEQSNIYFEEF